MLYYNIFAKNINRIEERAPRRFSIRLTFKTVKHKDQSTKIYFKPVAAKVENKKTSFTDLVDFEHNVRVSRLLIVRYTCFRTNF